MNSLFLLITATLLIQISNAFSYAENVISVDKKYAFKVIKGDTTYILTVESTSNKSSASFSLFCKIKRRGSITVFSNQIANLKADQCAVPDYFEFPKGKDYSLISYELTNSGLKIYMASDYSFALLDQLNHGFHKDIPSTLLLWK